MKQRMLSVMLAVTVMLAGTAGRLAYLMVGEKRVAEAMLAQTTKTVTVTQPRGVFLDRNGLPLVNTQTRTLAVLPPTVAAVTAVTEQLEGETAAAALAKMKSGNPAVVEVPSSFSCEDALCFTVPVRYAAAQPAVHWLGYLDGSGHGVTGLEAAFDDWLSGETPLTVTYSVDALGRPLSGLPAEVSGSPQPRRALQVTLDSRIQRLAETAAEPLKTGAVLVMDAKTGEILAAVSRPGFSPLDVAAALNGEGSPLVDRTLSAYNVGSVFKLCVAAAALKAGVSPERTTSCTGCVRVGENDFHCHLHSGHGALDMTGALAASCNDYFIKLGLAVGGGAILDMATRLGFNRAYSLADTLTAPAGAFPSAATLADQPAAVANLSFGQGRLLLSPLHVATMVAAIANGGWLVTPTLVTAKLENGVSTPLGETQPRRAMTAEQAAQLRRMMQAVVASGTGQAAQPEQGVSGGKTATAETGWVKDGRLIQQAWFAGFWPEEGTYAIVVLREDGQGGAADCAPVFKALVDAMAEEGLG